MNHLPLHLATFAAAAAAFALALSPAHALHSPTTTTTTSTDPSLISMPITDGHVHLVDPTQGFDYSWSTLQTCVQPCAVCTGNASHCGIFRSWSVDDYRMVQPMNTTRIVFMEVSTNSTLANPVGLAEARWVQHLADTAYPAIQGIIGRCPLENGAAVDACLAQMAQIPLTRGIRSDFTLSPNGTSLDPDFVAGIRLLAKYNFTYDVLGGTAELGLVAELAAAVPDVTFIIDHLGGPKIANQFSEWAEKISNVAALPNTRVKISGGPQGYGGPEWTREAVAPYVNHCLDAFGLDRAFYAGNWFWVNNYSNLAKWSAALWQILEARGLSPANLQALYHDNAGTIYRL